MSWFSLLAPKKETIAGDALDRTKDQTSEGGGEMFMDDRQVDRDTVVRMLLQDTIRVMRNNAMTMADLDRSDLAREIQHSIMDIENLVDLAFSPPGPMPLFSPPPKTTDNLPPVMVGGHYYLVSR